MRRKSTSERKGLQAGISKHRVRNGNQWKRGKSHALFGLEKWKIIDLGRRSFDFIFLVATKLRLVGFTRNENHEYVPLRGSNKLLHGLVLSALLLIGCQKTWGTLNMLISEDLRLASFISIAMTLVYLDAMMIGFGVIAKPEETMDLLNSWSKILPCLREMDHSVNNLSGFHDISTSLMVVAMLLIVQGVGMNAAMLTFIMDDIPISLFRIAKTAEWIPDDGTVAPIWWKLLLFPIEYISHVLPMIISACGVCILFVSLGVLKVYLREMGKFRVADMRTRAVMEKMYLNLTQFNRVVHVWIRLELPLMLLALSLTVILTLFISIRYTQLPLAYYLNILMTGITVMLMIFGICYDMTQILRATEDILDQLWSHKVPYLEGLTKVQRGKILKKAKAMRPLVFRVGDSEFSLGLPVTIWEEILNQIVFLLSL